MEEPKNYREAQRPAGTEADVWVLPRWALALAVGVAGIAVGPGLMNEGVNDLQIVFGSILSAVGAAGLLAGAVGWVIEGVLRERDR